jgi:hypothetical protein
MSYEAPRKPYILTFGRYRGKVLSDPEVPDDYVRWVASRGKYMRKTNENELEGKIPVDAWMAGRVEMERRGYDHIGERFIFREA